MYFAHIRSQSSTVSESVKSIENVTRDALICLFCMYIYIYIFYIYIYIYIVIAYEILDYNLIY